MNESWRKLGSIKDTVLRVVGDHLGIPGPTLSMDDHIMEDLGADSLDRLELMMTIEELFGIKIAEDDIAVIERIGDIVEAVRHTAPGSGNDQVGE